MKTGLLIALPLFIAANLTACINVNVDNPVPIEDRTWVLEKYGKQNSLQSAMAEKETTAKFDNASGKVSGSAGCNSFSASYQKNRDKLTVSMAISTKMFCPIPNGIMQQETQFLGALQGAESYKVVNGKLEIYCSDARLLVFHAK
jgi:heat shock protein HslJ